MSRAYIALLRTARQMATGHKLGMVKTDWDPHPGQAAGPVPSGMQAPLEAWLAHVTYGYGALTHPLGYGGLADQRWYSQSWMTPHTDQLVIQSSAPDNWTYTLIDWEHRTGGVVESGGSRVVVGFDDKTHRGWIIGPGDTAIVLVGYRSGRRGPNIELEKLAPPPHLAKLAANNSLVLHEHPTDRMLSALVRRILLTDKYMSPHDFFSFGGDLGIEFGHGHRNSRLSEDHPARTLGFDTAGELVQGCLTNHFLGIRDVAATIETDEWVAIEDQCNGARLLLRWRRP